MAEAWGHVRLFRVADAAVLATGPYYEACTALGIEFDGTEWHRLSVEALGGTDTDAYREGESVHAYYERGRRRFAASLPDHPLLGRLWDLFGDTRYLAGEVRALREECTRALAAVHEATVADLLHRLVRACDAALEHGEGLVFGGG